MYTGLFSVIKNGENVAPDSTPTAVCFVDGVQTEDEVTVTLVSVGVYQCSVTPATDGSVVEVLVTVTVDAVTQTLSVFRDVNILQVEVDGVTVEKLLTVLLAVLAGKATVSGKTVSFKGRDGVTSIAEVTVGSVAGERTASSVS